MFPLLLIAGAVYIATKNKSKTSVMNGIRKEKGVMSKWTFQVTLWDEFKENLLVNKYVSVKRVTLRAAREYIRKKYPLPYYTELASAIHYK